MEDTYHKHTTFFKWLSFLTQDPEQIYYVISAHVCVQAVHLQLLKIVARELSLEARSDRDTFGSTFNNS